MSDHRLTFVRTIRQVIVYDVESRGPGPVTGLAARMIRDGVIDDVVNRTGADSSEVVSDWQLAEIVDAED